MAREIPSLHGLSMPWSGTPLARGARIAPIRSIRPVCRQSMKIQELELTRRIYSWPRGGSPLANNMESIMSSKILAGAAALALTTVLVTAGPASAQNWGCNNGCYPNYAYAPAYNHAPLYGNYGGSSYRRLSYPGGPQPSTRPP